jgi:aldose 1-epimerase
VTSVEREPFGETDAGSVYRFVLQAGDYAASVLSFGATLQAFSGPDREGRSADVVLGCERLEDYLAQTAHLGASVGRCANRIAGARFELDGAEHRVTANEAPHHLHGGRQGFGRRLWRAEAEAARGVACVALHYPSPDGEEGYPGRLDARVSYSLSDAGALRIDFGAESDRPTLVNLTNHSYFHLGGDGSEVRAHELQVAASRYTPVDRAGIPSGELASCAGTPLDFRAPAALGARIDALQGERGGVDHNLVLDRPGALDVAAARLHDPRSRRTLTLHTSQPGLQLYTANRLDGSLVGKRKVRLRRWGAICLEAQNFPDAVHRASFPSPRLEPGAVYRHTTIYTLLPG